MQFCTKTPVNDCGCRVCEMFALFEHLRWVGKSAVDGSLSASEVAAETTKSEMRIKTLQQGRVNL